MMSAQDYMKQKINTEYYNIIQHNFYDRDRNHPTSKDSQIPDKSEALDFLNNDLMIGFKMDSRKDTAIKSPIKSERDPKS